MSNENWDDFAIDQGLVPRIEHCERIADVVAPLPDQVARIAREQEKAERRLEAKMDVFMDNCGKSIEKIEKAINVDPEGQRNRRMMLTAAVIAAAIAFLGIMATTILTVTGAGPGP